MDKIFEDFKSWIVSKNSEWKMLNVTIEDIIESTHAHQVHVNLQSKDGFGHVGVFESNDIYWIEFEGVARNFETFYKYVEFDELPDLRSFENDYIRFLTNTT